MTVIVGMDLATTSGFAFMTGDRLIHAESFRPAGKDDGAIFAGFRSHLHKLLIRYQPKNAAIEQPLRTDLKRREYGAPDLTGMSIKYERAMVSMDAYLRLYGLRAVTLELCHAMSIPVFEANQAAWRSAFLGVTRAPAGTKNGREWLKQRALSQCRLLKFDVTQKDAAEAVGVAFWLGGTLKLRKFEDGDLFAESAA